MRAATDFQVLSFEYLQFQSTQPMRAATFQHPGFSAGSPISIHAAHAGCDLCRPCDSDADHISIHAAHAGCDLFDFLSLHGFKNFNPRSPCGLRLQIQRIIGRLHNSASELALFFVYTCVVKKEPTAGKSFLYPFLKIRE